MLIFTNPGLIDLAAVTTLGVSVKQPGSFGRFGTGLKFAVASVLRGGGSVMLWRGLDCWQFQTRPTEIRGQQFDLVELVLVSAATGPDGGVQRIPLGITTMLGRDWQPWMALREFGCNALDEGGEFGMVAAELGSSSFTEQTMFVVDWPELDACYSAEHQTIFVADRPALWQSATLRILAGPSDHLYYRGVRVFDLAEPSALTYDLLDEQSLTEDRTLANKYGADRQIAQALLKLEDRELLRKALTAASADSSSSRGSSTTAASYESGLDYDWFSCRPGRAFLDVGFDLRGQHRRLPESLRAVLLRQMRDPAEEFSPLGHYRRALDDRFRYAVDVLRELGVEFAPEQVFAEVAELPSETLLTMCESGRVYFVPQLLKEPARRIAEELLLRWAELHALEYSAEGMARLLVPLVLRGSETLQADEQLLAEDLANEMAAQEEAEAGEQTGSEQEAGEPVEEAEHV